MARTIFTLFSEFSKRTQPRGQYTKRIYTMYRIQLQHTVSNSSCQNVFFCGRLAQEHPPQRERLHRQLLTAVRKAKDEEKPSLSLSRQTLRKRRRLKPQSVDRLSVSFRSSWLLKYPSQKAAKKKNTRC